MFAAWAAAVTAISLLPGSATPPTFGLSDIVLHGALYLCGGLSAGLGWRGNALLVALAAAAALGGALELAQAAFVADRTGEWHDAAANIAGLVVGLIFAQTCRTGLRLQ